jgi:hypothetical protein
MDWIKELDAIVRQSGEPLEGNICYLHHDHGDQPHPWLEWKRWLWKKLMGTVDVCVEIGVNAGHSAALALAANPRLIYIGIDPCRHSYTLGCAGFLAGRAGHRFSLIKARSPQAFLELGPRQQGRYLWSVDGDHRVEAVRLDLAAVTERAQQGDLLWANDSDAESVDLALRELDPQWREQETAVDNVRVFRRESLAAKPR